MLALRNSTIAICASIAAISSMTLADQASAATVTDTFTVQMTITSECLIQSATDIDFGSEGVINAVVDATGSIGVQCTNTTAYTIALDAGVGSGASVAARKMSGGGGASITYSLYRNAAHSQVWGQTIGTDTQAGTGNGSLQSYTVYGRVPVQATPAPGGYLDTITVTVTY